MPSRNPWRLPRATGIGRAWRRLTVRYHSWRFRRRCTRTGGDVHVMGPCLIQNEGTLIVGDGLVVRSPLHNPVDLSVGPGAELLIGNGVFLNQGVRIACSREIRIGHGCQIGDESVLLDSDYHGTGRAGVNTGHVVLEDSVWLATRVIVLRGVTIGQGCAVGAGSVVTRSLPPHCFAAGAPARVIRSLHESAAPQREISEP